jgi:hypothetical protein
MKRPVLAVVIAAPLWVGVWFLGTLAFNLAGDPHPWRWGLLAIPLWLGLVWVLADHDTNPKEN